MSREVRRQSSCTGKQRFDTAALAQRVAARGHRGPGRTRRKRIAYPCAFCGGWHVGSPIKVARAR